MAGRFAPQLHATTERVDAVEAVDDPVITPEVCARAARMVINSAKDAQDASLLLEMLGLAPEAAAGRHLRVVA